MFTHPAQSFFGQFNGTTNRQIHCLGILSRRLLNRGDFGSLGDLRDKMTRFIDYFNKRLAKPFKWTYKGKPLAA
jgi:hypothetical protein